MLLGLILCLNFTYGFAGSLVTLLTMRTDTWLARTFSGITGGGPRSGMSLQFVRRGTDLPRLYRDRTVHHRGARHGDDPARPRAAGEGARGRGGRMTARAAISARGPAVRAASEAAGAGAPRSVRPR